MRSLRILLLIYQKKIFMDFLELEWIISHSGLNQIWHLQRLFQLISILLTNGELAFTQLEIKETVVHAGLLAQLNLFQIDSALLELISFSHPKI